MVPCELQKQMQLDLWKARHPWGRQPRILPLPCPGVCAWSSQERPGKHCKSSAAGSASLARVQVQPTGSLAPCQEAPVGFCWPYS